MPVENHILTGKFKKVLLTEGDLRLEIPKILPHLKKLRSIEGMIKDYELIIIFILIYLHSRVGRVVTPLPKSESSIVHLNWCIENPGFLIENLPEPLKGLFELGNHSKYIYEFILRNRFLKLPGEIQKFLQNHALYSYPIELNPDVPDALEMLKLQASGRRRISLSIERAINGEVVLKRDSFELLLHDLSHAYTFYDSRFQPEGQIKFFFRIQNHLKMFEPYLKNQEFKNKFHYLISDMNSHPEHLKAFLKAIRSEYRGKFG